MSSESWDQGWATGQFEKAESILAQLVGLHGQAKTTEGKAALDAAVVRIAAQHKRQFPEGRDRLAEMRRPQ